MLYNLNVNSPSKQTSHLTITPRKIDIKLESSKNNAHSGWSKMRMQEINVSKLVVNSWGEFIFI